MNGIDAQLSEQIVRVLRSRESQQDGSGVPESMEVLIETLNQCLAGTVPTDVRKAALEVSKCSVGIREGEGLSAEEDVRFRSALHALQRALEEKQAQEDAADELANDPELVQEFLVEAREHLASVEAGMLVLEQEPDQAEALNGVFRSFHTIKGLAGFLGATSIHELAHETENVLDLAQNSMDWEDLI